MKSKIGLTTILSILALGTITMSVFSQASTFSAPQNMGATLNSSANDVGPVISPSGLSLYLATTRPGGLGGNDIWVSQRPTLNSAWGAPQHLGATLNSSAAETIGSFSLDGRTMFLQSGRPGGFGLRDMYLSTRTDPNNDFGWTTPVNLGAVVNTASDELAPTYFEDPITGAGSIIFSTDRVGTPGFSFRIYQSTRNADGTFNTPTLINELNGPELDQRVAIRRDGLEIFLSTGRPGGVAPGQVDIWVSNRASTTSPWRTPVLVPGINSVGEDLSPSLSPDGSILYFHSTRDGATDLYSATRCSLYAANTPCNVNRSVADFDGDGRTDLSVFRPAESTWYVMESGTNTFRARQFGASGDKIVPGDYDGDGRIDLGVFRPSDRNWYIQRSSDNMVSITNWGLGTDKPVPGDYDGDGRTDIAVFRNGVWYIVQSSNGALNYQYFGLGNDIPVAAANSQF